MSMTAVMSRTAVMRITDTVFEVNGKNVLSLVISERALLLSSQAFDTVDDFNHAWTKTLTLAVETEIRYSNIQSITKGESDDTILIQYKGTLGMPSECAFSFTSKRDLNLFYDFLEHEQCFRRIDETLSPILSAKPYIVGLMITIGITFLAHFQAIRIANGTVSMARNAKARLFNGVIALIGDHGIWTIGILVSCYAVYKIWSRFANPQRQTVLLPVKV